MSVTIELPSEIEDQLRAAAARRGQDAAAFVRAVVEDKLREENGGGNARLTAWADFVAHAPTVRRDAGLRPLADAALERESIYEERGL